MTTRLRAGFRVGRQSDGTVLASRQASRPRHPPSSCEPGIVVSVPVVGEGERQGRLHGRGCAGGAAIALRRSRNPFTLSSFLRVRDCTGVNRGAPMTKQEEYVENAVESLELAERLASSSDRRRMLKLAEAWVELANGTHDRGCHPPAAAHARPCLGESRARRLSPRPVSCLEVAKRVRDQRLRDALICHSAEASRCLADQQTRPSVAQQHQPNPRTKK